MTRLLSSPIFHKDGASENIHLAGFTGRMEADVGVSSGLISKEAVVGFELIALTLSLYRSRLCNDWSFYPLGVLLSAADPIHRGLMELSLNGIGRNKD